MAGKITMDKQKPRESIVKASVINIDGKDYKVNSHFGGTETGSKLLYDMAVSRILNEKKPREKGG